MDPQAIIWSILVTKSTSTDEFDMKFSITQHKLYFEVLIYFQIFLKTDQRKFCLPYCDKKNFPKRILKLKRLLLV